LNSVEQFFLPSEVNLKRLLELADSREPVDDFEHDFVNWSSRDQRTIKTYKFQSPYLDRRGTKKLVVVVDPQGRKLNVRMRTDSGFLSRPDNIGSFSAGKIVEGQGPQEIVLRREDFNGPDGKELEWSKIATFEITVLDTANNQKLELATGSGTKTIQSIMLVE
jgi:hypothetical protein